MPGPEECFESKQALNARFRESNRNISPIEKDYHTNLKECKNDILFIAYLETGEILITHTKRNKERFVVMSDDMLALARRYEQRRKIFSFGNPYFFPSANGGALTTETVYSAFNRAWSHADLSGKYPRKVRVYDLRHRFASACLNRWLANGENLMAMLPFLREYIGHNSLSETAHYVHILPENIIKSSAIDWGKFNAMFPEVTD